MTFKYPSFVLVNTEQDAKSLVEWCEHIGYNVAKYALTAWLHVRRPFVVVTTGNNVMVMIGSTYDSVHHNDCGTNIEMFKALVAVNDENVNEQYFVNTDGSLYKVSEGDLKPIDPHEIITMEVAHKASRNQIMQWFSDSFLTYDGDCQIRRIKVPNQTRYIVTHPYGTVQLSLYPETEEFPRPTFGHDLYVDENYRRKGVASALLDVIERLTVKNGYKSLWITFYPANTPRWCMDWYKRRGYKVIEHNRNEWYNLKKEL